MKTMLILEIVFYILILVVCGLLSAAGKAITSVNRNSIRSMADDGDKRAEKLVKIFDHPARFLSAVQVVITFAGFLASAMVAHGATMTLRSYFVNSGIPYATQWSILILTVIVSCIFLVFARTFPKQVAIQHSEGVALALAGYAGFFSALCRPFVAAANGITNLLLVITQQHTGITDEEFSEEDVMSMLEVGQETGVIKEEGKKMINSIFAFDDKLAYEVMTPRTDVFSIDINAPASDYINDLMGMRYSRIPVYDNDSDNIIGILNIKDYMIKAWEYGFDNVYISKILRDPFFVPDSKNIDALFFELQKTKQHIAILIDEYGGFTGIVTMEDLIEEVMGDIDDEYDEEEPKIEKIDDETFYIDGAMDLDDINEETGSDLESENSETVGGLLIDILGEIPDDEEHYNKVVEYENYTFTIESVKDRRLERIRMHIAPAGDKDEEKTEEKE
ncbi:MAG: hemolysin family protein [Eubacteriaceae bacterium]|nr:hemolysin family protein [Eubacteriaceae bacterium]